MKKFLVLPLFLVLVVPSVTLAAVFNHDLRYGMVETDVQTLQKFLNIAGFTVVQTGGGSPGNETTKFGQATQAALTSFQKSYNITPATGYFGPETRARANAIIDAHPDWTATLSGGGHDKNVNAISTTSPTLSSQVIQQTTRNALAGVKEVDLDAKIEKLRNDLLSKINTVSNQSQGYYTANSNAIALTNRIDTLTNTTITTPTLTGGTITNATISGGSISGSTISGTTLSVSSGTFSGNLTVSGTGTSTFAGDSNFDAGTLFVDSLNNRVGIGTTSPTDALSVNGPIFLSDNTPSATSNRLYSTGGSLYWNGSLVGGGSVGNWTLSGSNVYRSTGNVGIGTTSPYAPLSVVGSGGVVADKFTATSTTATTTIAGGLTVGTNKFSIDSNGVVTFKPNNSTNSGVILNYNTVDASTVPIPHQDSLRIIGSDGNYPAIYLNGWAGARPIMNAYLAEGTAASPSATLAGDELFRLSGRGYGTTAYKGSTAALSFFAGENFTDAAQGGWVGFRTTALGTSAGGSAEIPPVTAAVTPSGGLLVGSSFFTYVEGNQTFLSTDPGNGVIRSSGGALFGGNVGIGTTSPYAPLSVAGNGGVVAESFTATSTTATSTFSGAIISGGTLGSTKACATGYVRVGPNTCLINSSSAIGTSASGTACTQSTALSGVSDAKAVLVKGVFTIQSQNAVGLDAVSAQIFAPTDTTCSAGNVNAFVKRSYEYVAVTAGATISFDQIVQIIRTDTSGRFYFKDPGTSTSGSTVGLWVMGYLD